MLRGITTEIDLGAAEHNLTLVRQTAGGRPVIAVVKADAYGHGARELSKAFERAGAYALAVAFVSEAAEIRDAGVTLPLLVLFDVTDVSSYFDLNLTPVIHDIRAANAFSDEAKRRGALLDVHLKVDTGMGRLGLKTMKDISSVMELPNLNIKGLMSHFSEADLADSDYMELQLKRFLDIKGFFNERGLRPICHMANSAAVISFSASHLDAVRPGLMLYGCSPLPPLSPPLAKGGSRGGEMPLKPVMKAKAKVLSLRSLGRGEPVSYGRTFITRRETLAAVVSVGYADGYIRAMSNNSHVVLNGRRAPVMGRVCMDLMVVDATDAGDVRVGDDAVLLGDGLTAWELAASSGTIPYEILTSFGSRSKKSYLKA